MNQYLELLGHHVKDVVTGFEGVVDSISFDLYGCVQVAVTPTHNAVDPDKSKGRWFDFKRLTKLSDKPVLAPPSFAHVIPGDEIGPAQKPER